MTTKQITLSIPPNVQWAHIATTTDADLTKSSPHVKLKRWSYKRDGEEFKRIKMP